MPNGYSVSDGGTGMNPYVILEKLMVPRVSGKTGAETIGRFGVGFYTALSHLKSKQDSVTVETFDGARGHTITFKIHEGSGDVFVRMMPSTRKEVGTTIRVTTSSFDAEVAKRQAVEAFATNRENIFFINGEHVNDLGDQERMKGRTTDISFSNELGDVSHVYTLVRGVPVPRQGFTIRGAHLPTRLELNFPTECRIGESRDEIEVNDTAIRAMKEMIGLALRSSASVSMKVALCNTLAPIVEMMQKSTKSNKKEDNLITALQDAFSQHVYKPEIAYLPNEPMLTSMLAVPGAQFIHPSVYSPGYVEAPGVSRCAAFESKNGTAVYLVDFKPDASEFIVRIGKNIYLSRKVYEMHKTAPASLNVYFSNLDNTGQNIKERDLEAGKFTDTPKIPETGRGVIKVARDRGVPQRESVDSDTDLFVQLVELGVFKNSPSNIKIFVEAMLPDHDPDLLSERDRQELSKRYLVQLNNRIRSKNKVLRRRARAGKENSFGNVISEEEAGYLRSGVRSIVMDPSTPRSQIYPRVKEYVFKVLRKGMQEEHLESPDQIAGIRFWVNFLRDEHFAKYAALRQSYRPPIEGESGQHPDEPLSRDGYSEREYIGLLGKIHKFIPLSENARFFDPLEHAYFLEYLTFCQSIIGGTTLPRFIGEDSVEDLLEEGMTIDMFRRADEVYKKVIAGRPLDQVREIVSTFSALREGMDTDMTQIEYQKIPRSIRGYMMYIIEGGEIVHEKDFRESTIAQSEYDANIPLSSLVQSKREHDDAFLGFSGTPAQLQAFVRDAQHGQDPSQALRSIMHSANNVVVNDGYLWIQKMLRNSLDASLKDSGSSETPLIQLEAYVRAENGSTPDLVIEARDGAGMDLHTIINFLLIPGEKDLREGDASGKFGQGFFTIFGDAKEVLIQTSKGSGIIEHARIRPIKDSRGATIDFSAELTQTSGNFKGTVIQKTVVSDIPQLEAAFCKNAAVSYGGLMDRNKIQLNFGTKQINTPRTVLAETIVAGVGAVKIYDANEFALTQNGFYIKQLDDAILSVVPSHVRDKFKKHGIVLDIPASIRLLPSEKDIASGSQADFARVVDALPALAIRSYIALVATGRIPLDNVPYDYFEEGRSMSLPSRIREDVGRLLAGGVGDVPEVYLQSADAFTQLLTALPAFSVGDEKVSLADLRERFIADSASVITDKLPPFIQNLMQRALDIKQRQEISAQRARAAFDRAARVAQTSGKASIFSGLDQTLLNTGQLLSDRPLPSRNEALQREASTLYAYDQIVKSLLNSVGEARPNISYYLRMGMSIAHAWPATRSIGFNLQTLEGPLRDLKVIIEQRLPASDMRVQKFMHDLISVTTHERQHNLEGTEEGQWTHNDTFFAGQRNVLAEVILKDPSWITRTLDEVYDLFPQPTIAPTDRVVELLQQ